MADSKPIWIPTWLGLLIAAGALWLVIKVMSGGDNLGIDTAPPKASSQASNEAEWIVRGQAAVRAKLKDPDSAQFRNVRFHQGKDGVPMTCGEVNSKNSFGGYGGFQGFVSAGKEDLTFLAEQMDESEFAKVWNQFCTG